MSRYTLNPVLPQHEIIVGWDAPLNTFFGIIKDTSITDEEQNNIICWIGGDYDVVKTTQELKEKVSNYARIPDKLIEQLQRDRDQLWTPGPAQLFFQKMKDNIKRSQGSI